MSVPYVSPFYGSIQTQFEYTSQSTQQTYNANMNVIMDLGEKNQALITPSDVDAFNIALTNLRNLAQTSTGTDRLTTAMARGLDAITQSSIAANNIPIMLDTTHLLRWKDLYLQGVGDILHQASVAGREGALHSLQSFVQIEYVQNGNDQLYTQLASLKEAISARKEAIELLTQLQNLKNGTLRDPSGTVVTYLTVEKRDTSLINGWNTGSALAPSTPASDVAKLYQSAAKPLFENRIQVIFQRNDAVNTLETVGLDLLRKLTDVVNHLEAINPTQPGQDNLQTQLITLRDQFVKNGTSNHPVLQWILDNYDSGALTLPGGAGSIAANQFDTTKAGDYQRDLTKAMSTATSDNDALKVDIQRALFVSEEFYKSAQMVITMLHGITTKMAQKMKGN